MSVSAGGVSYGKGRAPAPDAWSILAIASDPKKTSERLTELTKETAKHMKAVALHGKADEIDALLEQTKQDRSFARKKIGEADERAKKILENAQTKASGIISQTRTELEGEKRSVRTSRERVKVRENAVTAREAKIDPVLAEAETANERAQIREDEAERLKSSYEGKVRRLKDALREAKL